MKIKQLEIKSGNVAAQLRFYRDVLGLEILSYTEESFEVKMGFSVLRMVQREIATPYHIAIHIPDRQEEQALEWIKERVPVLKNNNEEIIDFSNWRARSVYFYDSDDNIMEFISRRELWKPESALFTAKSLLGIAEVGLATGDIEEKYQFLHKNCSLEVYDGNFEKFCAIGDDTGLLITINKNAKDWFPTEDKAFGSEFTVAFSHNEKDHQFKFEQDKLQIKKS